MLPLAWRTHMPWKNVVRAYGNLVCLCASWILIYPGVFIAFRCHRALIRLLLTTIVHKPALVLIVCLD